MQIDENDQQLENEESSIGESFESHSNVTVESEDHSEKQYREIWLTSEQMQIEDNDEQQENAEFSMRERWNRIRR
jgi:hypothetical protein